MIEDVGIAGQYLKIRNINPEIKSFSYKITRNLSGSIRIEFIPRTDSGVSGTVGIQSFSKKDGHCSFIRLPRFMWEMLNESSVNTPFINQDGSIIIDIQNPACLPQEYIDRLINKGCVDSLKDPLCRARKPRFRNYMLIIPRECIGFPTIGTSVYGELVRCDGSEIWIRISTNAPLRDIIDFRYDEADCCYYSVKFIRDSKNHAFENMRTKPVQFKYVSYENNVLKFKKG
jgi:hypothetical protein